MMNTQIEIRLNGRYMCIWAILITRLTNLQSVFRSIKKNCKYQRFK